MHTGCCADSTTGRLQVDRALGALSRAALASPEACRVLEQTTTSDVIAAVEESPGRTAFLGKLQANLKKYGQISSDENLVEA